MNFIHLQNKKSFFCTYFYIKSLFLILPSSLPTFLLSSFRKFYLNLYTVFLSSFKCSRPTDEQGVSEPSYQYQVVKRGR